MAFSDDQLALLSTARDALHSWQETAGTVDIVLQQIEMSLPSPDGKSYRAVFTWDAQRELFDIST